MFRAGGARRAVRAENAVARAAGVGRCGAMGAKYLPTIKDQRANERYRQKQQPMPKFKKSAAGGGKKRRKG